MPTSPPKSESAADPRWQAVLARDAAWDGRFVFAVATTGVYCRPSCGSRRARRDNVSFFADPAAAEAAGYRPCLRCRPDLPPLAERRAAIAAAACRAIDAAPEPQRLAELAAAAGLSAAHFHRLFKAETGLTPRAYAAARRAERLRDGLTRTDATVTAAAYDAGFNSSGRFYAAAGGLLGMTPTAYRAGGGGETIRFAVGECVLGSILVAESGRGVCAILLGDSPEAVLSEMQDRFPKANLIGGDAAFERRVATVVGCVENPARGFDLPLDVRGTAFQQRVWQALRKIPAGATVTYADVAAAIGAPEAVRAVAGAVAANPVAVVVPCHRVVRRDGGLAGYRWGVDRKRALLDKEKTPA